jgi:acyl-coenzyme A thioesterase PaaI-like protein
MLNDLRTIQLPHTGHCLVCGRLNPYGLKLDVFVAPENGLVMIEFIPRSYHVGFEGIVHGGLLTAVMDEAMTWAATWKGKRFCMCGELLVRFRHSARAGDKLRVEALVDFYRHKLIEPSAKLFNEDHQLLATAGGKYIPMTAEQHKDVVRSFTDDPSTHEAAVALGLNRHEETIPSPQSPSSSPSPSSSSSS